MKRILAIIALLTLTSLLTAAAHAGAPLRAEPAGEGAKPSAMDIEEYYKRASGADADELPEGLRVSRWDRSYARIHWTTIITSPCLRYDSGEFSRLFFTSPLGKRIRELFAENGVNADKVGNLLKAHSARGHEVVSVFDEGYMILTDQDEKANYVFPIARGLGQKLFVLSQ